MPHLLNVELRQRQEFQAWVTKTFVKSL